MPPPATRQFEIRYDPVSKVAYIYLKKGKDVCWVDKVVQAGSDPRVTVDLDEGGKVIGVELVGVEPPVVKRMDWSNRAAIETVETSDQYL